MVRWSGKCEEDNRDPMRERAVKANATVAAESRSRRAKIRNISEPTLRSQAAERSGCPALLLACGNTLRQDDGVGMQIAEAAEQLFPASRLRVVAAQQFTPEMAADLAGTELAIFVDANAADEPGAIRCAPVCACAEAPETHRLDPAALLAMAESICGHTPAHAFALTVGASHFGYGEDLSGPLRQAVPRAVRLLTSLVGAFAKTA
jgi:hydrogenase maturation protease